MADSLPEQAQAEVSSFRPGTIVDGRYRVLRLIGGGGNGLVHEVEHMRTGQRLALKSLLDPTMYQRLEQEARATSILKSPRAVKIVDMGTSPTDGPYLVMELLAGQNLRELLSDAGQLPLEMTVNIALQVGECLSEAHAVGIIHRDLKPDNIHLAPGPKPNLYDVKVLDFGIVKIGHDAPVPGGSLTRTGSTVGTPYYMSLEQLRNPSGVDGRSDLFSLGVVLYECLSGRKPYDADTIGDLVYALCSGPPTDLARLRPDLPAVVSRAVMRALAPERDERHESVIDLCRELAPGGDRSVAAWIDEPQARPAAPAPRASPGPFAGAPTPSGVRPKMLSQATEIFQLPEGGSADPYLPPEPAASANPYPPLERISPDAPEKSDEGGGRRDTPTTFYVKPEGHEKPELPERVPDSQKTQMIDSSKHPSRSASGPSPVVSNPNASFPKQTNPYTKTAPFSMRPDLSGLPPPGAPLPPAFPNQSAPAPNNPPQGFGFAPPPAPGTSGVFPPPQPMGASGVFGAPPTPKTSAFPAFDPAMLPPQGMQPPGMPPQGMQGQPPGMHPPGGMPQPYMTGSNMPRVPIPGTTASGSNLPMVNIPGTTGPLPHGGNQPPAWMATSYQGAQRAPAAGGNKIAAFWNNAPQKTQIAIAAGAAALFVIIVLLLLWAVVR
jgi:eukaryotic-like serine/threonine-protein kinase